jgi:hypothetical protein
MGRPCLARTGYLDDFAYAFGSKAAYHHPRSTILTNVNGRERSRAMWDTVQQSSRHLSHEMPCTECGHAPHTFLPCSETCDCTPRPMPGSASGREIDLVLS